jgi:hypothetical protein
MAEKEPELMALPTEEQFKRDLLAINKFQQVAHANMVEGHDFGVIPGTKKPTLLKPGAEKIAKLLGLADSYEILDRQEDWERGFFRYLIKCSLTTMSGVIVSEGVGECNSKESKYRWRWVFYNDLPDNLKGEDKKVDRAKLTMRYITTSRGKSPQWRFDNDDIFSQVNTILKMAKKRALVDAALSAGRLSEVFTQDIEDMGGVIEAEVIEPEKPESKAPDEKSQGETGDATAELLSRVAEAKGFKSDKTARSYLVKSLHIEDSRIDSEPEVVWEEIKEYFA